MEQKQIDKLKANKGIVRRSAELDNISSAENIVEGTAVVFGVKVPIGGMFYEEIDPTAFESCDMDDVKMLYNHDDSKVIARQNIKRPARNTMQISIDEKGLHFRSELAVDKDPDAQSAYSKVSRGDVDQCSFGFTVSKDEWRDMDKPIPTRKILGIGKLYEVSLVAFPAYDSTSANARGGGGFVETDQLAVDTARANYAEAERRAREESEFELTKAKLKLKLNIKI